MNPDNPGIDPTVYAIPLFTILILIELYLNYRNKLHLHDDIKDDVSSVGMGLGSLVLGLGVKAAALAAMFWIYQFAIFNIPLDAWWSWVLIFFADDFSFYWHHRLSHQVRILWAAHVNHHSSQQYNLVVALRQSWTELFYKYAFWLWLPLIGFHPLMIMTMMAFSLIYQFWVHTKTIKSLGFLEYFMNTPSHHRVHHASNVKYLDRNHAGILIIWDKMFGTFQNEEEEPVYGLTTNIHTYNLLQIAFHEFKALWKDVKRAPNVKTKLAYIFMPPGWSHDGSTKTANQLREEIKTN
jgi:sterol desaturase/sphingolipid hydroxylase (fatty acid hydroxylase superfamily)